MKIGLLVECDRYGLEIVVCRRMCELIQFDNDIETEMIPIDSRLTLKNTSRCFSLVVGMHHQAQCLIIGEFEMAQ